jgi:hypothetical protein
VRLYLRNRIASITPAEQLIKRDVCRNDLDGLPYLDAFVHEVLRIYSPVPQTRRDAISETVVPLGHPMRGRDGKMIESIVVPKNTPCMLGEPESRLLILASKC